MILKHLGSGSVSQDPLGLIQGLSLHFFDYSQLVDTTFVEAKGKTWEHNVLQVVFASWGLVYHHLLHGDSFRLVAISMHAYYDQCSWLYNTTLEDFPWPFYEDLATGTFGGGSVQVYFGSV